MQVERNPGVAASALDEMEGNFASSTQEPRTPPGLAAGVADVRGRHRIRVELNKIQEENRLLQEESQLLDSAPPASKACKEMIDFMASSPDPFITKPSLQQQEPAWNRWFETPVDSTACCCWSLTH
ncbi:guanine nucleotide-binding protein subunit gamma 1-like [Selaginella moellendorffii]|uniref:guanine nucleotide-binding protein subunit gamma 1-like n=1 Tax=Selaginella moellendorffii TaxID=88036 RepID=UPI000D1C9C21|nr:guanine nucleotide-binding protein subunit gamma 1-like [Selaginella moellendorffii]|eukprot:XP_024519299.1 guanine nucleotide-binding protein subunit gamma 1-like [Selaginella moellendorffii]